MRRRTSLVVLACAAVLALAGAPTPAHKRDAAAVAVAAAMGGGEVGMARRGLGGLQKKGGGGQGSSRFLVLGSNHKTGTFFLRDAEPVLASRLGIKAVRCTHWHGIIDAASSCTPSDPTKLGLRPTSTNTSTTTLPALVMVRTPFEMAVSALLYHRFSTEKWEHVALSRAYEPGSSLLAKRLVHHGGTAAEWQESVASVVASLGPRARAMVNLTAVGVDVPELPPLQSSRETYLQYVKRLSDEDAITAEMVRTLRRDLPNMMEGLARARAAAPPHQCVGVLDQFMQGTQAAAAHWRQDLLPCIAHAGARGGSGRGSSGAVGEDALVRDLVLRTSSSSSKGPRSSGGSSSKASKSKHTTAHTAARAKLVGLAERIDRERFGSIYAACYITVTGKETRMATAAA